MVLILNSSGSSFDLIGVSLGDKIPGEIISIGRDTVFVDTAPKIDGLVEKDELLNGDGELPYNEGDALKRGNNEKGDFREIDRIKYSKYCKP